MTPADLIAFEADIAAEFEAGHIHAPVHLSGGNEQQLIDIFREVRKEDWVFSTWRSHYHALLKGIPPTQVRAQIMKGRSMLIRNKEYNFYTSSMVGGCLPIACGVATVHKVWCFLGDMAATTGTFSDAVRFASARHLNITFVVEDNGFSTNTPTQEAWRGKAHDGLSPCSVRRYTYKRTYPHYASRSSTHESGKF